MQVEHMGQALLCLPGSRGIWMHPELIRDMSGGSDMSGSGCKDLLVRVQEHVKGNAGSDSTAANPGGIAG